MVYKEYLRYPKHNELLKIKIIRKILNMLDPPISGQYFPEYKLLNLKKQSVTRLNEIWCELFHKTA